MTSQELTANLLGLIEARALALFEQGRFSDAEAAIAQALRLGFHAPHLIAVYAICLSEMGEHPRAVRALEAAREFAAILCEEGEETAALEPLLASAERSVVRTALRGDAARWLPRLPRSERTVR